MRLPRHTGNPYGNVSPVLLVGRPELEHKFLVDADAASRFAEVAADHLTEEIRDRAAPVSTLVTTYFDTADRRLFRSSRRTGLGRVRIRQYASAADAEAPAIIGDVCAFELKEATAEARRKARIVATPIEIERLLHHDGWLREAKTGAVKSAPLFQAASAIGTGILEATLTTTFHRRAWIGDDIRLTLDEGIQFAAPARILRQGELAAAGGIFSRIPHRVIEVKLEASAPSWLFEAMRGHHLSGRFSKYRDGLLAAQRMDALAVAARRGSAPIPSLSSQAVTRQR